MLDWTTTNNGNAMQSMCEKKKENKQTAHPRETSVCQN